VVSKFATSTGGYRLSVASGLVKFEIYSNTTSAALTGTTTVTTGVWHHLAGVFEGGSGNMRVYLDGVQNGTKKGLAQGSSTTPLEVGATVTSGSFSSFFNGLIDEVRMSNVCNSRRDGRTAGLAHQHQDRPPPVRSSGPHRRRYAPERIGHVTPLHTGCRVYVCKHLSTTLLAEIKDLGSTR
jgi:hypothetical protein